MEWIHGSKDLGRRLVDPVVTIGNFDGVHRGHRAIMDTVLERARQLGGESVVYTFEPHPRAVLQPDRAPRMLMTLDQKLESLDSLGVDVVVVETFDAAFAKTSPETFVRSFLHERLRPREVYVGYDFHYGRDREGSMRLLTETGPQLGFSVTIVPEVTVDGRDVNSTRIRELIEAGKVEDSKVLLGHTFAVRGQVVRGDERGRTLGFPTANLDSPNETLPAAGVYAGWARVLDQEGRALGAQPAVANIGVRPTFHRRGGLVIEVHLLDFEGDLYGRPLEFAFESRLRAEQRFSGVEALKAQIARDRDEARRRLLPD